MENNWKQPADGWTTGSMVWHLSLRWRTEIDRAMAPFGLTHAQYIVLAALHGIAASGVRPNQRQLAERTGLRPIYVSKLVRGLEADGFIATERDPQDARALRLSTTDHAASVMRKASKIVRDIDDRHTQALPPAGLDIETFRLALAVLLDASKGLSD